MDFATTVLTMGKAAFAVAGIAAGCRLLGLAGQDREAGASGLAAGMIFIGGAGLVLIPIGSSLGETATASFVALSGEVLMRGAIAALWVFLWRVFYPGRWQAMLATFLGSALLFGTLVWDVLSQSHWAHYDTALPSHHATQLAIALPFFASAWATGVHWQRSRRQLALGLGDAVTANRFLLWAIACSCFVAICGLGALAGYARGIGSLGLAHASTAARGLLYLPIAGAVWLGLFTPAAWTRRIRYRAGA